MCAAQRHAAGTVLSGKFRIVRLLGEGGMGAVYEVEHLLTHHRRALKLLHPGVKELPEVVQRFFREASAAGRIGNPHIVETFDAGELASGEPYLVMELLSGEPLSKRIARKTRLELTDLASILLQVAEAVHAAHQAGIIHRDLKPDNIFIVDKDGQSFPKILDFGISKFTPGVTDGLDSMTREGSMLGTPYYMAPEQLIGVKDVDARVDVWALGVILYECAAGTKPFDADTLPQLALLVHQGQPVPIAQLRPDFPAEFAAIVEKAMARDRAHRTSTARELADALARFASGTVAAVPPSNSVPAPAPQSAASAMASTGDPPSGLAATSPDPARHEVTRTGWGASAMWAGIVALVLVVAGVVTLSLRTRNSHVASDTRPTASLPATPPEPQSSITSPAPAQPSAAEAPPASAAAPSQSAPVAASPPPATGRGPAPTSTSKTQPAATPPTTSTAKDPGKRAITKGLATENPIP